MKNKNSINHIKFNQAKDFMRTFRRKLDEKQGFMAGQVKRTQGVYAKYETGKTIPPSDIFIQQVNYAIERLGLEVVLSELLFNVENKSEMQDAKSLTETVEICSKVRQLAGGGYAEQRAIISRLLDVMLQQETHQNHSV